MKLREILPPDADTDPRHADLDVGGVTADSRVVKRGDVFVAIAGNKADGARFIAPAIAAGAIAIIAEQTPNAPLNAAFVRVGNARRALALAAAKFYPRQPKTIAAVTGTSALQICRVKAATDVLPLVPVTAAMVLGWRG